MKIADIKQGDDVYVVHNDRLTKVRAHIGRAGGAYYTPPGHYSSAPFRDDAVWTADELPAVRKQRAVEARARKARHDDAMKIAARLAELGVHGLYQNAPTPNPDASITVRLTTAQAQALICAMEAQR